MKRKLKICHVITRMIVGGAQENTLLTIVGHVHAGHEVVLVTGPSSGPEGELLRNQDFPEFEIVENPHLLRKICPYHDVAAFLGLKRFFQRKKFDVVHTHSSKAGILGRAAAWSVGVPFVVHTIHGQAFHRYEKPWKNFIYIQAEKWAARRCHKIYAVARAMIDQCVDSGVAPRSRYMVVYSGMDLSPFLDSVPSGSLREKLSVPDGAKVIGAVARLFPLKGYEYFFPVAFRLAEKHPDIHFLIVGDGIMMESLKKEIARRSMEKRFSFAGLVAPSEIPDYIAIMDILVHLSLREGLPRAVVQAMASARPVVGFALDGTPEAVINGKTGFIVAPEDVDGVENALEELLSDPGKGRAMGEAGRKFVMEKWDWRKMAEILEKEYLEHVNN